MLISYVVLSFSPSAGTPRTVRADRSANQVFERLILLILLFWSLKL